MNYNRLVDYSDAIVKIFKKIQRVILKINFRIEINYFLGLHFCDYFVRNNEVSCWISQGFKNPNFVNIGCDERLTPTCTYVGAKLN